MCIAGYFLKFSFKKRCELLKVSNVLSALLVEAIDNECVVRDVDIHVAGSHRDFGLDSLGIYCADTRWASTVLFGGLKV